jgi:2-dehydropantoate 2-reductase
MWPEHVAYMRSHGLQLSGMTPEETYSVPVNAVHISDVQAFAKQRPIDIAFISVKSYDTQWATMMIKPYLAPDGFVVSLQNCINEEFIADVIGWGKTLGTAISGGLGAELYAPGHIKRTAPLCGDKHVLFRVGEIHGGITERAQEVARLLRHVDSAKVSDNLWGERWAKLSINAMRNGLSAVTAMSGNDRDLNEMTRWVSIRLGSESVRVGQALGYRLADMPRMDVETLARAGEGDKAALAEMTKSFIEASKARSEEQRPSMAQDIAKGRRTETSYINGYVAAKGREIGVPAPVNAKIDELVQRVERGDLKASIDNVKDI